jgi:hypothetical protein
MSNVRASRIDFGCHSGRTLPHLLFVDPDYFFWGHERNIFNRGPYRVLHMEAVRLYERATSIRIPPQYGRGWVIEYIFASGRFEGLRLSPANMALDGGGSRSFVKPVIDMSIPRSGRDYDKCGMKILLRDMKEILFGDPSHRITERRAADFFNDDRNFAIPEAA